VFLLAFRWFRRILYVLVVAAIVLVLVTAFRVWWVGRQDQRPRSDAIVVLGAAQYDGRPSAIFKARLAHALTLYDEHVASHLVTLGGKQPGDEHTEAGSGAAWLAQHGVSSSAIVPVRVGDDTYSSLAAAHDVFTKRGWHSAVLVSDPWHELRCRAMAGDLGIDAATSPEHSGPAVRGRGTEVRYIARETAGYLYYEVFGGTRQTDGPAAV
jgi:vancomycin permeability regulator SanA